MKEKYKVGEQVKVKTRTFGTTTGDVLDVYNAKNEDYSVTWFVIQLKNKHVIHLLSDKVLGYA